jgi:hypothetical protein
MQRERGVVWALQWSGLTVFAVHWPHLMARSGECSDVHNTHDPRQREASEPVRPRAMTLTAAMSAQHRHDSGHGSYNNSCYDGCRGYQT